MPQHLSVVSLRELCLESIPVIVKMKRRPGITTRGQVFLTSGRVREGEEMVFANSSNQNLDYEHREQFDQYDARNIELDTNLSVASKETTLTLREYFINSCIPGVLDEVVNAVLQGIENAVVDKNSELQKQNMPVKMARITTQMYIIISFVDAIVSPSIMSLDISNLLQPSRTKLYSNLKHFTGMKHLNLAEGSYGYVPELYRIQFIEGIKNMPYLSSFSLHYDCFDDLIKTLACSPCSKTLRNLDIEYSVLVTDQCAPYFKQLSAIRFMYSKEHLVDFLPLSKFQQLRDLYICGGDFYDDKLLELVEIIGGQLSSLYLQFVDTIDIKAIVMLSVYCKRLTKLSFSNCGFIPVDNNHELGAPGSIVRLVLTDQSTIEIMQTFKYLEHLCINSTCDLQYTSLLLKNVPQLKSLDLGLGVEVNDYYLTQVARLIPNLEKLKIRASDRSDLTIQSVETMLSCCPDLCELTDLRSWSGVYPREIQQLIQLRNENGWILNLGKDNEKDTDEALRRAGLKEKFDRLRDQFGDMVMIP